MKQLHSSSFGMLETLEDRRLMSGSVFTTGGIMSERASDIVLDSKGNRYVSGSFAGTADFQPGSGKHAVKAKGEYDGYVARYDKNGKLTWVYTWGKKGATSDARSLSSDPKGNVIVGASIDAEGFDNDTSQIIKLDKKGDLAWKKTINAGGWKGVSDVHADAKGNVYATGTFNDTLKFGATTLKTQDSFDTSIFIVRYDKSGKVLWAKDFSGDSSRKAHSLVTDSKQNVYVAGYIYGATDFDPASDKSFTLTTSGFEGYVAKLDKNGAFAWAKKITGAGDSNVNSVNVDAKDNVYVAGDFNDSLVLDGVTLTEEVAGNTYDDAFIAKLDPSGKALWAKAMGGTNNVTASNVVVDGKHVYFSGSFVGTADLNPDAGKEDSCACIGWSNGFVVKMKQDGKHVFSRHIAQKQQIVTSGSNSVGGLAVDKDGNMVIAGTFEWETDFDPSTKKDLVESVNWDPDIFVLTLDAKGKA